MAHYTRTYIQKLLHESDTAQSSDRKGEKLEALVRYLFSRIPGVSFADRNILDQNRAHEIDLAFWNPQNESSVCFLDAVLIVECKNTGDPVGSSDVGWLVRKLQDRGCRHGVLVALSGITGAANGEANAHSEILTAMVRDGIRILVITREEILSLQNADGLVEILKEKELQLTLYKTVA